MAGRNQWWVHTLHWMLEGPTEFPLGLAGTWWGPLGTRTKALSDSLGEFPQEQAANPCFLHGHRDKLIKPLVKERPVRILSLVPPENSDCNFH